MANRYFLNIGANWGDTANWSDTSGGTGGFSVPTNADDVFFDANSGNCTVNASNRVAKSLDFTGYTNTITMTFGITVSGNVTLVAAITIAGASGLTINATGTFTSNGKTWPNALTFSATNTLTLADDLTVGGLLTISGATTVNGSYNVNINGGISLLSVSLLKGTGSPLLYLQGGDCTCNNAIGRIYLDTYINGNISVTTFINFQQNTLTHLSGTITWGFIGAYVRFYSTCSVNATTINFQRLILDSNSITLLNDLNVYGSFEPNNTTFNGTYNINCYGGGVFTNLITQGTGVTSLNLISGNFATGSSIANTIALDTYVRGNISFTDWFLINGRTFTYVNGNVNCRVGSTFRAYTATYINMDKINFRTVIVNDGATLTMNKFFSGSALIQTRVQSRLGANYTIAFQDGFEKITKFTKISNCTVANRGQLLCITDKSNKGGNVGVRYINQSPNGIAKNANSVLNPLGYPAPTFLAADPNFIIN